MQNAWIWSDTCTLLSNVHIFIEKQGGGKSLAPSALPQIFFPEGKLIQWLLEATAKLLV
jgi:hypothetical protein